MAVARSCPSSSATSPRVVFAFSSSSRSLVRSLCLLAKCHLRLLPPRRELLLTSPLPSLPVRALRQAEERDASDHSIAPAHATFLPLLRRGAGVFAALSRFSRTPQRECSPRLGLNYPLPRRPLALQSSLFPKRMPAVCFESRVPLDVRSRSPSLG